MHHLFSRFLTKTDFILLKVAAALFADSLFVWVAEAHIINDLRISYDILFHLRYFQHIGWVALVERHRTRIDDRVAGLDQSCIF